MTEQLNVGFTASYPSSTKLFMEWYRSVTNATAGYQTVFTWAALDLMEAALYRASLDPDNVVHGRLNPAKVLEYVSNSQASTPAGRVIFDPYGVNSPAASIFVQAQPSSPTAEIVAPSGLATSTFVYPMPSWEQRIYKWSLLRGTEETKAMVVAILCSGVLLFLALTAILFRRRK